MKGNRVNIPEPASGLYGNISEPDNDGGRSGKSYLFFLTVFYPGINLYGDRVLPLGKRYMSVASGALLTSLETSGESI